MKDFLLAYKRFMPIHRVVRKHPQEFDAPYDFTEAQRRIDLLYSELDRLRQQLTSRDQLWTDTLMGGPQPAMTPQEAASVLKKHLDELRQQRDHFESASMLANERAEELSQQFAEAQRESKAETESAQKVLCADHAQTWYTARNTITTESGCVFCDYESRLKAARGLVERLRQQYVERIMRTNAILGREVDAGLRELAATLDGR